jgi:hypothetical protein
MTHHPKRNLQVLGSIDINETSYHRKMLRESTRYGLGFAWPEPISREDPILIELQAICELNECTPKLRDRVEDTGLGWTINALVSTRDLSKNFQSGYEVNSCILLAQGRHIIVQEGDVFLLNTNIEHTWIANCRWLLVGQGVRIKRAITND